MTATGMAVTLLACVVASWVLRVLLVAVLPAERLPSRVRKVLPHVAPAVLAALVAGHLARGSPDPLVGLSSLVVPTPTHLALLGAGLVAWRWRNLAAPVAAALLVMIIIAGSAPT